MGSESLRPQAEDFPTTHAPGDFLVPFASLQKELAAAAAKLFLQDISPSADGDLLCPRRQSRQNAAGGRGVWERPAADALVFQAPLSPGPPCLRGSPLKHRQLRPARRPHERCLKIITAVLLNN